MTEGSVGAQVLFVDMLKDGIERVKGREGGQVCWEVEVKMFAVSSG